PAPPAPSAQSMIDEAIKELRGPQLFFFTVCLATRCTVLSATRLGQRPLHDSSMARGRAAFAPPQPNARDYADGDKHIKPELAQSVRVVAHYVGVRSTILPVKTRQQRATQRRRT